MCCTISTILVLMEMHINKDKEEIIQQFRADKIIQGTQMIDINRILNQLMRIYKPKTIYQEST